MSKKKFTKKNNSIFFKFILLFIFYVFIFNWRVDNNFYKFIFKWIADNDNKNLFNSELSHRNKIIEENFFIIDSNNLDKIYSHMYGFSVSKKGILTNNYYKTLDYNEDPEPQGIYIMIKKTENEIRISQDFSGSYGLYIYKNEISGYFALSNSFLLLEEYLADKENITFNKDFSDNLIISGLSTPSTYETLINEICIIPPNSFIVINLNKKEYKIYYIDYKERSIPLESEEGLKIIDKWIDKWTYIFRSLKRQTDNISSDLSGGFDSRIVLSILLNSGINLNKISIFSINGSKKYNGDFKLANKVALKLGFKLNNWHIDNNGTKMSIKDSLFCSIYSKLGITNWFRSPNKFLNNPKFAFSGFGGENIRGYPLYPIKEYINKISGTYNYTFYNSSVRICKRSIFSLKMKKTYYNDYEISADFYLKGRTRHHYGKTALEAFLGNEYILSPLIDPDIIRVKYDINPKSNNDLIAYIFVRLSYNLLFLPFSSNRIINEGSILKAVKLNKKFGKYRIKNDYNEKFYIDKKRNSPISSYPSKENRDKNVIEYLQDYFNYSSFIKNVNKVYNDIYFQTNKNIIDKISLIAIGKILQDLSFKNIKKNVRDVS